MKQVALAVVSRPVTSLTLAFLLGSFVGLWGQEAKPVRSVRIDEGELSLLFRDNSKSPATLSGIDSMFNVKRAAGFDAFDPDAADASAGLNFEHIISGHKNPNNKFTPRHGTYRLYVQSDGKSVKLIRRASDSPWSIDSEFVYRVVEPNYVDFEFRCTPRDASKFGRRGYAIFFFANYMNDVADVALHFRGKEMMDGPEKWISASAPEGPPDWNGGGNYRSLPADELELDDDVEFRLNTWSYPWPRITQPFYYGRARQDMTFMLMFDRLHSRRDQIRFSLYKFKLPEHPRPAWDFQYVIHRVKSNEKYGFSGRLVWKEFVSPEDCRREYERWAKSVQDSHIRRLRQLGAAVFTRRGAVVEVNANGTQITDEQLEAVSNFFEMTDLSLEGTGISDAGISRLSNLQKLEWLNLYRCPVGDAAVEELQHLRNLQHLPIGHSKVTDEGLRHVATMTQLTYLGLRGNAVTDEGVKRLRKLTRLTGLHLGETKVTDRGLPHLQAMQHLRQLWLDDTEITDAAVNHLIKLQTLTELHVRDTQLTKDAVRRLQRSLPKCQIESTAR